MNPGRTAVWSRWTTRRFSTLQCVSSANRTDNICSPDLRIRACGSAGLFFVPPAGPRAIGRCTFSAAVPPFRCRFIRAAGPALCHRPEFFPSAAAPPFRRRFIRAAGPAPCPRLELSLFCRRPSFSPPVHPRRRPAPVPSAGVPPLPRRRPALFLPKCPVAKCQSAVPRRDPAILLTIWQRSPIGTTFVCFMASPVKEPAGKMKTNN